VAREDPNNHAPCQIEGAIYTKEAAPCPTRNTMSVNRTERTSSIAVIVALLIAAAVFKWSMPVAVEWSTLVAVMSVSAVVDSAYQ
jgi:hypothetical protein